MQIAGYELKEGARFQAGVKPDAARIGTALESLRVQHKGELTPEDVVEAARSANSPLHEYFEWSDSAAAHQHRLDQARGLIRSVVAIYSDPKGEQPIIRAHAYTHVPEGATSHYRDTSHALSQKDTRKLILQRAWRELQQWRQRYAKLKEFADILETMDEIGDKIERKIGKV